MLSSLDPALGRWLPDAHPSARLSLEAHLLPLALPLGTGSARAAEACERRVDELELRGAVVRAQEAFAALDAPTFAAARDELYAAVPCLGEPLTASTASGVFRVRALDAFLKRAPEDLEAAIRAAAEIDATPPSSSIIPRGHPVRNAWEAALAAGPGPREPLPVPDSGRIRVDGSDTLERPVARPTLLQFVAIDGQLSWTSLVNPGEPAPTYAQAPESARSAYETAVVVRAPRRPVELPILAAALGASAVGTYAASAGTRARFFGGEVPPEELPALRATNNALVITAGGLGAAAVGVGLWTAAVW